MDRKLLIPVVLSLMWGWWLFPLQPGLAQENPDGILIVHTDPPGAEVLIDGTLQGVTEPARGLQVTGLKPGRHTLLVRKKWYRPAERSFEIRNEKRVVLNLSLGAPVGYLSIRCSLPSSRIEIKGIGSFPGEVGRMEVPVGRYSVKATPPGGKPITQQVEVEMGQETDLFFDYGPDAVKQRAEVKTAPVDLENLGKADRPVLRAGEHIGARVGGYLVPEVIPMPEGSFLMGSESGGEDEKPVHEVFLNGFDMARLLVTNAQFKEFCRATQREMPKDPQEWGKYFEDYADHPVVNVSWEDATAYCEWLSKVSGVRYRLPTEAEWEYAARGGLAGKTYPWGDDDPKGRACYLEGQTPFGVPTMRVGSFPPNGYGLYDMAGNVWQWCWDWYDVSYYRSGNNRNPEGAPDGVYKVARGGAWLYGANSVRSAIRLKLAPDMRHETVGFRVVRVVE